MKKPKWMGPLYLALGILLAVGPKTIFSVCPVGEKPMKCHWSAMALLVLGGLLALAGILCICFGKTAGPALGLMAAGIALGALLVSSLLIGGCGNTAMACRTTTFPMVYLLAGIALVAGLAHGFIRPKVSP